MGWGAVCSVLLLSVLAATQASDKDINYTGHRIISVTSSSAAQLNTFGHLKVLSGVHFWTEPALNKSTLIHVEPTYLPFVVGFLNKQKIVNKVVYGDLQAAIVAEKNHTAHFNTQIDEFLKLDRYYTLEQIYEYLNVVALKYPHIATLIEIGNKTALGTHILGLRIGKGNKSSIMMDFGIHAREWISPATGVWFINHLLKSNEDKRVTILLNNFDFYIIPVLNPDGYNYTFTTDRMWRKNRVVYKDCIGVDLNRNFENMLEGKRSPVCNNIYPGPKPFSEAEIKGFRDTVLHLKDNLKAYFSIHSAAQKILMPWAHKDEDIKESVEIKETLKLAQDAVKKKHGQTYEAGKVTKLMGIIDGSSLDWMYNRAGVKYSYVFELRNREYGFLLPAYQIIPTAEEAFEGVHAILEYIIRKDL